MKDITLMIDDAVINRGWTELDKDALKKYRGKMCNVKPSLVNDMRSLDQIKTYWGACDYLATQTKLQDDPDWNTKEKVSEQVKIKLRWVDSWMYYENPKSGEKSLHIKTKSISFAECGSVEANKFFSEAFDLMALMIDMNGADELVQAVKEYIHGV